MKTRVLCITKTRSRGGTEKHLVDLVRRFDASRTDCVVLCMESDLFSADLNDLKNVKVVTASDAHSRGLIAYWRLFRTFNADTILFVNSWLGLFPWHAYCAARLCAPRRVLAIEHLLADSPERALGVGLLNRLRRLVGYHARNRWKVRLAGILSHKTITVSNAVRDKLILEYGYSQTKTVAILNGVDLKRYARSSTSESGSKKVELGLNPSDLIILCTSNLNAQKRIDVLLEAFRIVSTNNQRARCVILGSGSLEAELRAKAAGLGLDRTVMFAGFVADVRPYLEVADLFVLSSDKEGLPLSLGEAMAYGIPCVATDAGGNKEIVEHGKTGYIVKPGAPEQLAGAINYLLDHDEERARMGVLAQCRVRECFNIESRMKELINELVRGGDGSK